VKSWLNRLVAGKPHASARGDGADSPAPPPAGALGAALASDPAGSPRQLDVRALRSLVADQEELRKGTEVVDKGGLQHLARHGERVFAEASGSGASPYRVTITLGSAGDTKARCTCMAARSRPVCKHAAALLVAWARAPESFAVSDAPPIPEGGGETRRASVKTGRVKTEDLIGRGVEQALALVRELAVTGVGSSNADRPEQMRALAETLRANRLRRLSARVLELADTVHGSFRRRGSVQPLAYADAVADILLGARRIERHLAGETLEDRLMEELVGRTWRKNDRKPVEALALVEYAYLTRTTADGFVIRERRLLDLPTGMHYSEKQILPGFMAKRTAAIESRPGVRLEGTGAVYPGFGPHRLDMEGVAAAGALTDLDAEAVTRSAFAGPAAALAAFAEYRRDVFAPDRFPVAIRADAIVAISGRLGVAGEAGDAMLLPTETGLVDALAGEQMVAIIGDIELQGIVAVLHPLAVVSTGSAGSRIRVVPVPPDSPQVLAPEASSDWLAAARDAGASAAALSLGEIRDELAAVLVNGLGSLTERVAEPLAARMADLGMERPSTLLREIVTRPDPVDRLDDIVRLHQVLGIGAARLASGRSVDRAALIPVPGTPAVQIPDPGEPLAPDLVAAQRAAGSMSAYEAAVHRSRFLAGLPPEAFTTIQPWWVDGASTRDVAAAISRLAVPPIERIDEALALGHGLTAALTAIQILEALPDPRLAEDRLRRAAGLKDRKQTWDSVHYGFTPERAMRIAAMEALAIRAHRANPGARQQPSALPDAIAEQLAELATGSNRDRRAEAARKLAAMDSVASLPGLRRAWQADPMPVVRQAAAQALSSLGDVSMVDSFIDVLVARAHRPEDAKAAAYALGSLGDGRGVAALVDALAEGWKSSVILEALRHSGHVTVDAVVARALRDPAVAKRTGFVSALEPHDGAHAAIWAALTALVPGEATAEQAGALLRLAASRKPLQQAFATHVLAMGWGDTKAERQVVKAANDVVNPPARKKKPA
jgi:HEAT repeats